MQILEAITSEGCNENFSLERLEILGDAFLKFAVGRYLFLKHDALDEGQLTRKRSKLTNNHNLFKLAKLKNLQVNNVCLFFILFSLDANYFDVFWHNPFHTCHFIPESHCPYTLWLLFNFDREHCKQSYVFLLSIERFDTCFIMSLTTKQRNNASI